MSDSKDVIIARLKRRADIRSILAILGIVAGIPVCFVAPLFLGTIFWFTIDRIFDIGGSWSMWLWGTAALTIPLLLRMELRTRGDFLGEIARDIGPDAASDTLPLSTMLHHGPVGAMGAIAYAAALNPRVTTAGFVELFLIGPRLLIGGVRHLRLVRKIPPADWPTLVSLVQRLLGRETGFTLDELAPHFELRDKLQEALIWLAFYGWVGVSKNQDRVYIYSESRRFLT